MPKPKAMVDYNKCYPEKCDKGICVAALKCPFEVLIQDVPNETPYTLQDFCIGCGKCSLACPLKAIKML